MTRTSVSILLLSLALMGCGTQKAVRPNAPSPEVAVAPDYTIIYRTNQVKGKAKTIKAVYLNGHSPLAVELYQGNTVEKLVQISTWTQGAEYGNTTTRWRVQDNEATLIRGQKTTRFIETDS